MKVPTVPTVLCQGVLMVVLVNENYRLIIPLYPEKWGFYPHSLSTFTYFYHFSGYLEGLDENLKPPKGSKLGLPT